MSDQGTDAARGLSRRRLIRRAAAGAAVAWATPVLTTMATPAHAQAGTPPPCDCADPCQTAFFVCGESPEPCCPCFCVQKADGGCACIISIFFSAGCSGDGDCGPGLVCVRPFCDPLTLCVAPCGAPLPPGARAPARAWERAPV